MAFDYGAFAGQLQTSLENDQNLWDFLVGYVSNNIQDATFTYTDLNGVVHTATMANIEKWRQTPEVQSISATSGDGSKKIEMKDDKITVYNNYGTSSQTAFSIRNDGSGDTQTQMGTVDASGNFIKDTLAFGEDGGVNIIGANYDKSQAVGYIDKFNFLLMDSDIDPSWFSGIDIFGDTDVTINKVNAYIILMNNLIDLHVGVHITDLDTTTNSGSVAKLTIDLNPILAMTGFNINILQTRWMYGQITIGNNGRFPCGTWLKNDNSLYYYNYKADLSITNDETVDNIWMEVHHSAPIEIV